MVKDSPMIWNMKDIEGRPPATESQLEEIAQLADVEGQMKPKSANREFMSVRTS